MVSALRVNINAAQLQHRVRRRVACPRVGAATAVGATRTVGTASALGAATISAAITAVGGGAATLGGADTLDAPPPADPGAALVHHPGAGDAAADAMLQLGQLGQLGGLRARECMRTLRRLSGGSRARGTDLMALSNLTCRLL